MAAPSGRAIVLVYVVCAALWIALSDQVAGLLFPDPSVRTAVETLKGSAFVAVTGLLLAIMLHRHDALRARQAGELETRERRLRLLAEHVQDVIFRYALEPAPAFEYVSPAIERVLGYPPEAFHADPGLLARVVHPDDLPLLDPISGTWRETRPMVLRARHADGHWVWLEQRSTPVMDAHGEYLALEGVARDVTEQRAVEAALARLIRVQRTLSAANQALVRAEREPEFLEAICRAVVDPGGFRDAWVGYRTDDSAGSIRPAARAGRDGGYLDAIALSWHLDGQGGGGPAGVSIREGRTVVSHDVASDPTLAWRAETLARGYRSLAALPLRSGEAVFGTLVIYAAEPDAFGTDEVAVLEELAADLAYGVETLRARAGAAAAEAERLRLATVIEQSTESVLMTDMTGAIEYVNPAFERVTGYSRAEVIGRNPRLLQSGAQSPAFYAAMWQTLTAGRSWEGDLVNRRKDGSLITEEATISPVCSPTGATSGYVAVKRDVTRERQAEAREQARARERALVAHALAALHPQATPEETAEAVCRQIAQLPEATLALVLAFDPDGRATPLGAAASSGRPIDCHRLPEARTRELRSRSVEGPWVQGWVKERGHPFNRAFHELHVRALGYVPLRIDRDVVGLLEVGSSDPEASDRLTERLPALVEFAAIASAVLGPSISSRAQLSRTRERIRNVVEQRAFRPVFQPIVDLPSLAVIGYEALTRFDDGTPPDEQFREAAAVGLGTELEIAALTAALRAAVALPARPWLNVNVSPAVIVAGEPLRSIVASYPGRLVLEVTEHQAINDYAAFRAAVAALGIDVQVAVDDAGAGFASLRHILELRPQIVKIDRSLVAGIDTDPARQSLLAGLHHFADAVGCSLIAEGIETEGELATLVALDIHGGQGYLLGRPVPLVPVGGGTPTGGSGRAPGSAAPVPGAPNIR